MVRLPFFEFVVSCSGDEGNDRPDNDNQPDDVNDIAQFGLL
jgi:hypothetical protein